MREKYALKCSESVAKTVLYSGQFFWGLSILYETDWMPWFLFGKGSYENSIAGMPFTPVSKSVGLLCWSFVSTFSVQLIDICTYGRDRPDWHEMFAHHGSAVALTVGMIVCNNRSIGCVIAW